LSELVVPRCVERIQRWLHGHDASGIAVLFRRFCVGMRGSIRCTSPAWSSWQSPRSSRTLVTRRACHH